MEDHNAGVNPADLFSAEPHAQTDESKLLDVIQGVMSTSGMSVRSVLDDKHVVAITRGLIFADKYDSHVMRLLCQTLLEIRVSRNGRGRKDLIAALKSSLANDGGGDGDDEHDAHKAAGRFFS